MTAQVPAKPDYATFPRLSMEAARAAARQLMSASGQGREVEDPLLRRIERFYRREARLLDEERYAEWYALLADDLFYWMPLRENRYRKDRRGGISPDNMALFDESKADIAIRLGRLSSNLAWTEDPATRHVYIVTNIEAFETDVAGEYEVHSTFVQYRNRGEHNEVALYGRRRDVVRAQADSFSIARRLILLPQSTLLTNNLSVFF